MTASGKLKITASFKTKVKKDWQSCLPGLTPKKRGFNLSRIVGPLLISVGFGTKSGNTEYYPGFSVHNLCNVSDGLYAALDEDLKTVKTNAPDWLTVRGHEKGGYMEAAERMKNQAHLPLEGPVSLSMIFEAYKKYVTKNPHPYLIDQLQDPALIAAWAGEFQKAQKYLDWGLKEFSKWEEEIQADYGGKEGWYKMMQERINDPETLRQTVDEEIIKHHLSHIPREELVID